MITSPSVGLMVSHNIQLHWGNSNQREHL